MDLRYVEAYNDFIILFFISMVLVGWVMDNLLFIASFVIIFTVLSILNLINKKSKYESIKSLKLSSSLAKTHILFNVFIIGMAVVSNNIQVYIDTVIALYMFLNIIRLTLFLGGLSGIEKRDHIIETKIRYIPPLAIMIFMIVVLLRTNLDYLNINLLVVILLGFKNIGLFMFNDRVQSIIKVVN